MSVLWKHLILISTPRPTSADTGEPYYCVVKCDDCNANIFAESGYLEDAFELWNRRA